MTNNEPVSNNAVRPGIWSHYSGAQFEVIGVAVGSYLMGEVVVYRSTRKNILYYRPISNFLGSEEVGGVMVPRFTFVRDNA